MKIKIAENDLEIMSCFETLSQLRPSLKKESFLSQMHKQGKEGYLLAYAEDAGKVVSVAGLRITECIAFRKFAFIDDLVTDENERSKGYGDKLFDWIKDFAIKNDCKELHLDSGVQRFSAHRFYFKKRMHVSCYHFALDLEEKN